ncbi:aldose epimerase family protein [Rothia kristinae]|uniref:Aldose 1-epimerase n=1 Tax=Rothia kristinae TaxID=37923 RepID=A0A147E8T6_9MICC|nr:aldose epimerase family protein [Rothia kristinae]SIM08932.1 aldose 1-epimerase [Mycobacteroides abscessus subsp. abscessus]KTR40193.1 hypothetical protein RSA5_00975 [Rothia kristinae]KTR58450.1 hypothetical protein SA11R_05055 [Rothia kristinae]KTR67300.1 hypothetical protein SA12R_06580 [Rothia kristinae]KTR72367.1 hypothetical protein SA15R_06335 [Rothia kristinae]
MDVQEQDYGEVAGRPVTRYVLSNDHGTSIAILSYACLWQSFGVLEDGVRRELVVGFDRLEDYVATPYAVGKVVGRVAGRIAEARFDLDGHTVRLDANEGANTLHGGSHGLQDLVWPGRVYHEDGAVAVRFHRRVTPAYDRFPGTLDVEVEYRLDRNDQVTITFRGESDATTLFDPTCHVYFNVADGQPSLRNQWLEIPGSGRLDVDAQKIPTGRILDTGGTPYDFSSPVNLGAALDGLSAATGRPEFDDAYAVTAGEESPVAVVGDDAGHRTVSVYSDRNGLVVFTANPLDPARADRHDYNALALEAQTLPDAIHHADFGDIVLPAGEPRAFRIRYAYTRSA